MLKTFPKDIEVERQPPLKLIPANFEKISSIDGELFNIVIRIVILEYRFPDIDILIHSLQTSD